MLEFSDFDQPGARHSFVGRDELNLDYHGFPKDRQAAGFQSLQPLVVGYFEFSFRVLGSWGYTSGLHDA
jgi:hypothetical protein